MIATALRGPPPGNRVLVRAFNDFRRSTMVAQLALRHALRLIEDAELETFSRGTREVVELLAGMTTPRKTGED